MSIQGQERLIYEVLSKSALPPIATKYRYRDNRRKGAISNVTASPRDASVYPSKADFMSGLLNLA